MNSERNPRLSLYNIINAIQIVITMLIMIFQIFSALQWVSYLFLLSIILIPINIFISLQRSKKMNGTFIIIILLIITSFVNVFINKLLSGQVGFSLAYYKKVALFSLSILHLYYVCFELVISDDLILITFISVVIVSIVFLYAFIFKSESVYLFNGRITDYLTLGMPNPNQTSLFLLVLIIVFIIFFSVFSSFIPKFISLLCASILFYFLLLTKSRNTLIAVVFFALLLLLFVLLKFKLRVFTMRIIIWLPLIFLALYLILIDSTIIVRIFSRFSSEGKSINSRDEIWRFALDVFVKHPVTGGYYQLSEGTGLSQMHNTHIDVLSSYGIFVYSGLMVFLERIVKILNLNIDSTHQKVALIGFLSVIMAGFGEASLFSGGGPGFIILVGYTIMLSRFNINKGYPTYPR